VLRGRGRQPRQVAPRHWGRHPQVRDIRMTNIMDLDPMTLIMCHDLCHSIKAFFFK
jgi:hypothetical protein